MKLKKYVLFSLSVFVSLFTYYRVYALDNPYYENKNSIKFTEKEYNFFLRTYGVDYLNEMSQEDYEWYSNLHINDNGIEQDTYYDIPIAQLSNSHTTSSKKLTITKSCSTSDCTMLTTVQWLTNPTIRSYDVIGARFSSTSLYNNSIITRVKYSSGTSTFTDLKNYSNGFGVSVKLPSSSTDIIVEQKFYVNKKGTVYVSYQHATKNITLSTSKLYTISSSGYGSVFNFYGDALNVFDQMGGVNISI